MKTLIWYKTKNKYIKYKKILVFHNNCTIHLSISISLTCRKGSRENIQWTIITLLFAWKFVKFWQKSFKIASIKFRISCWAHQTQDIILLSSYLQLVSSRNIHNQTPSILTYIHIFTILTTIDIIYEPCTKKDMHIVLIFTRFLDQMNIRSCGKRLCYILNTIYSYKKMLTKRYWKYSRKDWLWI